MTFSWQSSMALYGLFTVWGLKWKVTTNISPILLLKARWYTLSQGIVTTAPRRDRSKEVEWLISLQSRFLTGPGSGPRPQAPPSHPETSSPDYPTLASDPHPAATLGADTPAHGTMSFRNHPWHRCPASVRFPWLRACCPHRDLLPHFESAEGRKNEDRAASEGTPRAWQSQHPVVAVFSWLREYWVMP